MSAEIIDEDLGFDDFFDKMDEIASKETEVGYTQASGSEDGIDVVDLALIHELGEGNPARPFMRGSFDNNETEIGDEGVKLLDKYLDDKIDSELAYEAWGDFYNGVMKKGVITRELGLEENKPATIKRKGSDTPLIDSKRMINSSQVMVSKK